LPVVSEGVWQWTHPIFANVSRAFSLAGVARAGTGGASVLFFFSIYWLLPNRKVPWRPVMRTAVVTGIVWLVAKYIFMALLPHLHLKDLYGAFYVSVGLLFWAYASGLIMFAGAQFSVARWGNGKS
jgi:membrane protein